MPGQVAHGDASAANVAKIDSLCRPAVNDIARRLDSTLFMRDLVPQYDRHPPDRNAAVYLNRYRPRRIMDSIAEPLIPPGKSPQMEHGPSNAKPLRRRRSRPRSIRWAFLKASAGVNPLACILVKC